MEHVCVNYNNNKKCSLISATVCEYIIETTLYTCIYHIYQTKSLEKVQSNAYIYIFKTCLTALF